MMTKLLLILTLGAGLLTLAGLPAAAQESQGKDADKAFAALDANQDGKLSQAEFGRHLEMQGKKNATPEEKQKEFQAWDADKDGSVSKAEFTAKYGR